MKKNLYISLTVLGILVFLYFFVCLVFSNFNFKTLFGKEVRMLETLEYQDNITKLKIDISSDDVIIKKSDDNNVHIKYYQSNISKYDVTNSDGVLSIKQRSPWFVVFNFNKNYTLEISIPNTKIDNVTTIVSSGDVNLSLNLEITNLVIDTSSGDVNINNITANNTKIDVSSGDVNLQNFNSDNLEIDTSSGSIKVQNINTNKADINVSSGKINLIESTIKSLIIDASSGNITSSKLIVSTIDIDVSSGDVNLGMLVTDVNLYKFNLKSSSGDISLKGSSSDVTTRGSLVSGSGQQMIKVNVSSGDINIKLENN